MDCAPSGGFARNKGSATSAAPAVAAETGSALRIPIHVNARGMALGIIATVTFVYALQWAQDFLVPLLLGILLAYTPNPLVVWLARLRLPRATRAPPRWAGGRGGGGGGPG